jgi:hypothetical protein
VFPHENLRYGLQLPFRQSKAARKKLRNHLNGLGRSFTVEFRAFDRPESCLSDIRRIDSATYQHRIGAGFDPAVARYPGFRAWLLYLDSRPVAFWVGSIYQGVFWALYTGYDAAYRHQSPA